MAKVFCSYQHYKPNDQKLYCRLNEDNEELNGLCAAQRWCGQECRWILNEHVENLCKNFKEI